MTYGNLVAIRQTDAKRLLAYSAIAHAGYLLMGLAVLRPEAIQAVWMYLLVYLFMNLGAFWVVIALEERTKSTLIDSFRGVAKEAPVLIGVLFICLVSLVGLPPTAGFSAKLALFKVVVSEGLSPNSPVGPFFLGVALVGVLNSVVSLFYYMKLIGVSVFEEREGEGLLSVPVRDTVYAVILGVPVLVFLYFDPLYALTSQLISF